MILVSTQFMYNCGALDEATSRTLIVARTAYMALLRQTLEPWLFFYTSLHTRP